MTKSNNQLDFVKISLGCKTDNQKVNFFDKHKEAFFNNSINTDLSLPNNVPKDLDDAFYVYANMKRMSEFELLEFRKMNWSNFPTNFKIFLFDFFFQL